MRASVGPFEVVRELGRGGMGVVYEVRRPGDPRGLALKLVLAGQAKRMLLAGDTIPGTEAKAIGLVLDAVPEAELDAAVTALAARMSGVPRNQLMMQKLMINQAVESMGLAHTQLVATLFDGVARHTPEGLWFKQRAEEVGFGQAVKERDGGAPIAPGVSR